MGASNSIPLRTDPYSYTNGRWLHQDELQRQARDVRFDFDELMRVVLRTQPAAKKVTACEKQEGGFNRVFLITLDSGHRLAAKIPTSVAGPHRLTTHSEVATMEYLRSKTSLPIPTVYAWNDDPSNPVGTEYIIQQYAEGIQLNQAWPSMDSVQHQHVSKNISYYMQEMANLDFPAFGSIYFHDAPFDASKKIALDDSRFCIGPACLKTFWNCSPGELELYGGPSPNCGPWKDLDSYALGVIETGRSRVPQTSMVKRTPLPYQGTVQEHLDLLESSEKVLRRLAQEPHIQQVSMPILIHPDMWKRNIFVSENDPTVITGIIDWQSAAARPAFFYVNQIPDFAEPLNDDQQEALDDPDTPQKIKAFLKDMDICAQTYTVVMQKLVTKLDLAMDLDPTLYRPFLYSHTTWAYGLVGLQHDLIELSAEWSNLGLDGQCPYAPSEKEIAIHRENFEDFETVQKLSLSLVNSIVAESDGWVPVERWPVAKQEYAKLYRAWMDAARESDSLTAEKADRMWPWDMRPEN
ncbi:hypothetical protein N7462_004508 [Penicillium macrosclerotiorum]|uniref:uncharacterized protein n=1 Tax=Penicillium macrosclerotiorum TaxID=303699 RepID=UPI002547768B|nr:uncharacterized protein N7462_004508 [Penicillium macrosclerotiorum]KAJ5690116.1 hypothetical protein N7462_004508 [Penicillium macrosclerotiorum]